MQEDILEKLQKEVYGRCSKETNEFGMGCYYHIVAVVKNAKFWRRNLELTEKL